MPLFRLIRGLSLPNYVNQSTQPKVLSIYRALLRAAGQCEFAFVQRELRHMIVHAFHSCRYITAPNRIEALVHIAEEDLQVLCRAFSEPIPSLKDYQGVLDLCLRSYKVTNSPLWRLFKPIFYPHKNAFDTAKTLHQTLLNSRVISPCTLSYELNNAPIPAVGTVDEFRRLAAKSDQRYFKLARILRQNNFTQGSNGRKIVFDPPAIYTALGEPVSERRQRNSIKRTCMLVLRDSSKPVHPEVLDFVNNATSNSRFARRRIQECAENMYSVSPEGKILRANIYSS